MEAPYLLRPAVAADAARVAEVYLASRAAHLSFTQMAHTPDEVRAWIAQVLLPAGGVRVAEVDGLVQAFGAHAMDNGIGWIEQLYAQPGHTGRGLGKGLLQLALAELRAAGAETLRLWCFQANTGARRFYERHGFVAVAFTDGRDNEEGCPDVLYESVSGN
jgi:GNAT superfamily N-acetyltransferase